MSRSTASRRHAGQEIAELRHDEQVSQAELARRVATTQKQLSRWEHSQTLTLDTYERLLQGLGYELPRPRRVPVKRS